MMMIGLRASRHRGQFAPITGDKLRHTIEKDKQDYNQQQKNDEVFHDDDKNEDGHNIS